MSKQIHRSLWVFLDVCTRALPPRRLNKNIPVRCTLIRTYACRRINCPDEVMARRIVERGKGSGRSDDHAGAAKVRIDTYHQQSSG